MDRIPLRKRWWWPLRMSNYVAMFATGLFVRYCVTHNQWPSIHESKFFTGAVAILWWSLRAIEEQQLN